MTVSLCLATVTSDDFAVGTLVMLHSFRRTNPWFDGEVVAIHDTLNPANRQALEAAGVRLAPLSDALREGIDRLVAARPDLAGRRTRFASLDAFRIDTHDRLLFCDSDLLFCGDIAGMSTGAAPLRAVGDAPWLRGTTRDRASFAEVARGTPGALPCCFNAGLVAADRTVLGDATWRALIGGLSPDAWADVATGHTDQLVLNRHFAGRVGLVAPDHNHLLLHHGLRDACDPAAARVLHFNGPAKPWAWHTHGAAVARNPALLLALRRWYEAYVDWQASRHLAERGR